MAPAKAHIVSYADIRPHYSRFTRKFSNRAWQATSKFANRDLRIDSSVSETLERRSVIGYECMHPKAPLTDAWWTVSSIFEAAAVVLKETRALYSRHALTSPLWTAISPTERKHVSGKSRLGESRNARGQYVSRALAGDLIATSEKYSQSRPRSRVSQSSFDSLFLHLNW